VEILLKWLGAQLVGLLLSGALLFRDLLEDSTIHIVRTETWTKFLAAYSDKLTGFGITLCMFALNDLIFRSTDNETNDQCVGSGIRLPAFSLLYLLVAYCLLLTWLCMASR
jgi:hypothetical protein